MPKRLLTLLAGIALLTSNAQAAGNWTTFRLSQFSMFQSGGSTFSGLLSYTPKVYTINDTMAIRADAGFSVLKSSSGAGGQFVLLELQPRLEYSLNTTASIEVGGGLQFWVSNGNFQKVASANYVYRFEEKKFGFVDHLVGGYTAAFVSSAFTHQIRVGFGI